MTSVAALVGRCVAAALGGCDEDEQVVYEAALEVVSLDDVLDEMTGVTCERLHAHVASPGKLVLGLN